MICCICGKDLPEESFYPSELSRNRKPRCKECHRRRKLETKKKRGEGIMYVNDRLCVCKSHSTNIFWSENMISTLKKNYAEMTNEELADLLNVSESTMRRKARELGLSKSASYIRTTAKYKSMLASIIRRYKNDKD